MTLLLAVVFQDADPVELKWSTTKGTAWHYEARLVMGTTIDGEAYGEKQDSLFGLRLEVDEVLSDGLWLKVTYERIRFSLTGGKGDYEYDSADPKEPLKDTRAMMQAALVGGSFRLRLSAQGQAEEVDGMAALTKDAFPRLKKRGFSADGLKSFQGFYTDENVKNTFQLFFPTLAQEKTAPGKTWSREVTLKDSQIGVITKTTSYTFKELRKEKSEAVIQGETAYQVDASKAEDREMAERIKMSEKLAVVWDVTSGRLTSLETVSAKAMSLTGSKVVVETRSSMTLKPEK